MRSAVRFGLAFSMLALVLNGCGGGNSPSAVVKATFSAANAGKYSEAEKHLAAPMLQTIQGMGSKNMWDGITKNGTLASIEILREEQRGEGASVSSRFHYKDGSTDDQTWSLKKDNGKWVIEQF